MAELLQGTIIGAAFLLPGAFSVAIALAPKAYAIRPSGITSRAVGLVTFAALDWFLALCAYAWLFSHGDHGKHLANLFNTADPAGRAVLASLLSLPPPVWKFGSLLAISTLLTGAAFAIFQHAAITGTAIRDFELRCLSRRWFDRAWFAVSKGIETALSFLRLQGLWQPSGAGYWLVLKKAADLLGSSEELRAPGQAKRDVLLVYADVLQGDEEYQGKVGLLYTGAVKHLVCETDGNIVFLLLVDAKRWTTVKDPAAPEATGSWRPVRESRAFALEGESIRNISFRLYQPQRSPTHEEAEFVMLFGDSNPPAEPTLVADPVAGSVNAAWAENLASAPDRPASGCPLA